MFTAAKAAFRLHTLTQSFLLGEQLVEQIIYPSQWSVDHPHEKNVFNTLQILPELLVNHCVALSADIRGSRESPPGEWGPVIVRLPLAAWRSLCLLPLLDQVACSRCPAWHHHVGLSSKTFPEALECRSVERNEQSQFTSSKSYSTGQASHVLEGSIFLPVALKRV